MKKKKSMLPVLLVALLVVIIVLVVVVAGAAMMSSGTSAIQTKSEVETSTAQIQASDTESVEPSVADTVSSSVVSESEELEGTEDLVLFGVDSRENNLGKGTRSDSMMIIHVDHNEKKVRLTSIYRDCMMKIEGHDFNKATHAYSYGGPELAISMLNENLDLHLENYVTVNFINVGDLVDEIDGVEQDVDDAEIKYINGYIDEVNGVRGTSSSHITKAGTYVLDGTQAVAYSRIRYTAGADYKRTERQRTILFKVFQKAKDMDIATRLKLASDMLDEISTSYHTDEVVALLQNLSSYTIEDMTAYPQTFYGGKVSGAWYEVPVTLVDMATGVHEFLYGEKNYEPSETVKSISNSLKNKASTANYHLNKG